MTREPTTGAVPGVDTFTERYELLERLGKGGMGEVRRARDRLLGRDVAIKELAPDLARHPDWRARRLESRANARVDSPYVARVFDHDERGEVVRIVFEFVRGETLAKRLRREGPLAWSVVRPIVIAIARGLDAAHRQGIVHRDLKPGNVMLPDNAGESGIAAKIVDLGIALGGPDFGPGATAGDPFRFAGTPEYMAPERLDGQSGPSVDIWAFGCVLFECLTNRRAFADDPERKDLLQRVITGAAPFDALPQSAPQAVRELVIRCLRPEPGARPDSMRSILAELDAAQAPERRARASLPPLPPSPVPRRELVAELVRGVREQGCVSVSGPTGIGKSWVARAALDRLREEEEVLLVDLAGVSEAGQARSAVDAALAGEGDARGILLLDNADGVQADLPRLVAELPRTVGAVIVTSRRAITARGWRVLLVEPLASPPEHGDGSPRAIEAYDAVRLFAARAAERRRGFRVDAAQADATAQLCRRLGGIPAAIELTAAHAHYLEPADLLERLDQVLRPLIGAADVAGEERTVEHTFAWSVERAGAAERLLLDRLAIFAGSWTLRTAEQVCCDDSLDLETLHRALNGLVDAGLVRFESVVGRSRYRVLAPVRSYLERHGALARDEALRRAAALRHLERCAALVSESYSGWQDRLPSPVVRSQSLWLSRMDQEMPDCRAAIDFARREPDHLQSAVDLAIAMQSYWYSRGRPREGIELLSSLIEAWGARGDVREVRLLAARARLQFASDRAAAAEGWRRALAIQRDVVARTEGAKQGIERQRLAAILHNLALVGLQIDRADLDEAGAFLAEAISIYETSGNGAGRAATRLTEGLHLVARGDLEAAERKLAEAAEVYEAEHDEARIAEAAHYRAIVARRRGDLEAAGSLCIEALEIRLRCAEPDGVAESFRLAGEIRAAQGLDESAVYLFAASARRRERIGAIIPRNEIREHEETFRAVRRRLGAGRFEEAWNAGAEATDREAADRVRG